ncbi:MAG: ATP-grasp domain-containing protein [Ruminococcus sp.]|nr:ATP-grasp domain-containing protein [Ruminococcus sp.]
MGNGREVVLVTAIGTMTATTVVEELKKMGKYYIIGGDIYEKNMVATTKDVDEFHVFPPAIYELDKYIEFVLKFCKEHEVKYYFAVIDEEIVNLSNNREKFEEIGVKLCIPNRKLVETCHFKNKFSEWLDREMPEISIKTFGSADEIKDEDFPIFVKPVEGRASTGCRRIDTRAQLDEFVDTAEIGKTIVAQQFAEGEIATVDIISNNKTGQIILAPRKELLRNSNGCGIAVKTFHCEKLEDICRRLVQKLELNGVVNAEFFCKDGDYKIIEINPRFSAGTGYSCMAGAKMVLNAMEIADGNPCTVGELTLGKNYAKRYETYEM